MPGEAEKMNRQNFNIPLLMGGATTSKTHTAIRIAPNYDGGVVYVKDASRAVSVVSRLLSGERREFLADIAEDYEKTSQRHTRRQRRTRPLIERKSVG